MKIRKLTEGIHLVAYGKDIDGNLKTYEDNDYPDKQSFKKDLQANEIKVISVSDNRDLYIMDHSDYSKLSQVEKDLKKYKQWKEESPKLTIYDNKIKELEDLLNKAKQVSLTESKHKVEEVSRNELLAKTKGETIGRYNRAQGYKGFNIVNIGTYDLLRDNTITVTCRVGDYNDTIQLEDVLYWIQICAEENPTNQINTKVITKALMNSIDGMDIKVDCECGDWCYRMAYMATVFDYKYGRPENRPADIRNPDGFGALCKHLTAMLSNKKWIQQVSSTLMDWCVKNIDKINEFLKPKEGMELTLPNELARYNAKMGFYSKLFKDVDKEDEETQENEEEKDNTQDNTENEEEFKELQDVDNKEETQENEDNQ